MTTPTLNDITLARAIEAYKVRQLDEAQRLFIEVLELEPDNPDALYFMGMIDHQSGRAEVAEHRATELVKQKPEDGKALNLLGTIEMSLGKLEKATETFTKGMRSDTKNPMLRVNAAICEMGQGNPQRSIELCKEAIAIQPEYANAFNIMGTAQLALSDFSAAAECFNQALELTPEFLDARFNLGKALLDQAKLDDALDCFNSVLDKLPQHTHALTRKADIQLARGNYNEAASGYQAALETQPNFTPACIGLGKLHQYLNKQNEALGYFKKTLELDPNNIDALMHAGDAFRKLDQPEAATAAFRDVLELDPDNFQARFHLSIVEGTEPPAKPDGEYVQRLFDEFADSFDDSLAKVDYNAPQQLATLAEAHTGSESDGSLNVLDLGCGTGLSGLHFKKIAHNLKGIDISPRMIDIARQRSIYDELEVNELLHALVRHQNDTDIAVCADTFPYIGDLESSFLAIASALRANGLFLFSVETHEGSDDYKLQSTARYSHSGNYIQALAKRRGFEVLACNRSAYRKEAGAPIDSLIVALRKTA